MKVPMRILGYTSHKFIDKPVCVCLTSWYHSRLTCASLSTCLAEKLSIPFLPEKLEAHPLTDVIQQHNIRCVSLSRQASKGSDYWKGVYWLHISAKTLPNSPFSQNFVKVCEHRHPYSPSVLKNYVEVYSHTSACGLPIAF